MPKNDLGEGAAVGSTINGSNIVPPSLTTPLDPDQSGGATQPPTAEVYGMKSDCDRWLDFFNRKTSIFDHTRDGIKASNDSFLEHQHNYIQTLFPNRDEGIGSASHAPLLTDELVTKLKDNNFQEPLNNYINDILFGTMLPFWGISHKPTGQSPGVEFNVCDNDKASVWVNDGDHNHLRITRVINFLMGAGRVELAHELSHFMNSYKETNDKPKNEYWVDARNGLCGNPKFYKATVDISSDAGLIQ